MIHVDDFSGGSLFFACDECPACEGWEHRLESANRYGYEPQFEYCGCDKMGDREFLITGYCPDAWIVRGMPRRSGKRRTGRAYRREQTRKKNVNAIRIANTYGYFRNGWTKNRGKGEYLKKSKHSHRTTYYKNYSNRINRRNATEPTGQRSAYKREFDYWWTID